MLKFAIWLTTYKPGDARYSMFREPIKREQVHAGEVARETVSEVRPDWGRYSPTVTLSALERHIRKSGLAPVCSEDQIWSYGFTSEV